MIVFRAIPHSRGGSLQSHVTRIRPQLSRHHECPPLLTERSDTIGCCKRQIRATSCTETGENCELHLNECWSAAAVKWLNREFRLLLRFVGTFGILEWSYLNQGSTCEVMARKDYAAEKGNVKGLSLTITAWQQQVVLNDWTCISVFYKIPPASFGYLMHILCMCIMYMSSLDIELAYITFSNLKSLCLRSTPVQPQMFTLPPRVFPLL